MNQMDRISINPKIMRGVACIQGTRVPVYSIIGMLGAGDTKEQILEAFPELTAADIEAALAYAAWKLTEQEYQLVHA
jgi:uncharacterized protein (DUF433 family)